MVITSNTLSAQRLSERSVKFCFLNLCVDLVQEYQHSEHEQNVVTNALASRNAFRPSSKVVVTSKIV
jgi:hypothetical protein